jgi:hypothetical protein
MYAVINKIDKEDVLISVGGLYGYSEVVNKHTQYIALSYFGAFPGAFVYDVVHV